MARFVVPIPLSVYLLFWGTVITVVGGLFILGMGVLLIAGLVVVLVVTGLALCLWVMESRQRAKRRRQLADEGFVGYEQWKSKR